MYKCMFAFYNICMYVLKFVPHEHIVLLQMIAAVGLLHIKNFFLAIQKKKVHCTRLSTIFHNKCNCVLFFV